MKPYNKSEKQLEKQKDKWFDEGRRLFAKEPIPEVSLSPIEKARNEVMQIKDIQKSHADTLMHLKKMVFWQDTLGMKTKVFDYEKDFTMALEHIKKCDGGL